MSKEPRVNEQITANSLRVIDNDGAQLGILSSEEALSTARQKGFDLVEVAPSASPPVCKLLDYGRYKYELKRKAKTGRKKQHVVQIKELRMRPMIEKHDIGVKINHAKRFLSDGNKVQVSVIFKGREIAHIELGDKLIKEFTDALQDTAVVEFNPRMEGNRMTVIYAPR